MESGDIFTSPPRVILRFRTPGKRACVLVFSEERGEEPMTSSGGHLIGSEVNRNKWSPQCGATSIEVAGISPGPRSGRCEESAVEGPSDSNTISHVSGERRKRCHSVAFSEGKSDLSESIETSSGLKRQ